MSTLVAFFAAIMLVIAGGAAPALAAPAICDAAPAECETMALAADHGAAATAHADHGHHQPDDGDAGGCDRNLACSPGGALMALPSATWLGRTAAFGAAEHDRLEPLAVASLPPDPNLRPPNPL